MPAGSKALRSASALVEAQLAKPEQMAALKSVASRYAVAITPAIVDPSSKLGNYDVKVFVGTLTVAKAVPKINWQNPASIIIGEALSRTVDPTALLRALSEDPCVG